MPSLDEVLAAEKKAAESLRKLRSARKSIQGGEEPITYRDRKARERDRQAAASVAGRDIGPLPTIADPDRRAACRADLKLALKTYFPRRFPLPFCDDHSLVIDTIQRCAEGGGLFALAMPRGSGKTTICECAVLLVQLYGLHVYAMLLAATKTHATKRVKSLKTELLFNDLLLADFPEVCYPIRQMGGIANRCNGQHIAGTPTQMEWGKLRIVLPTVHDSPASSAIIEAGGLLEAVRGANHTRPDGTVVRPTFAIVDDPQTRRSARSELQCEERESILAGDVLYLPGPDKRISAVMPCTVIEPGDMADRMLDRKKHPEWQGVRTKMLTAWPTDMDLWEQYGEVRRAEQAAGGDGTQANDFYREHQVALDAGAAVSWPERRDGSTLSGIQAAMDLWIRDPKSFMAEAQNEPVAADVGRVAVLPPAVIAAKTRQFARFVVPNHMNKLTGMIDVQQRLLYYAIVSWETGFTGHVVDYGTWPEQRATHFTLNSARLTLQTALPGAAIEAQIRHGLQQLATQLRRLWKCDDGSEITLDWLQVDAQAGPWRDTIYDFCAETRLATPSHGRGIKAGDTPMHGWRTRPGERKGLEWVIPPLEPKSRVKHVTYDVNWWKSFLHARLATAIGESGCLTLFDAPDYRHQMLAEHLTAEYGVTTEGRGRKVTEWSLIPGRENHLLDCVVGACVGASIEGLTLGVSTAQFGPRKRLKLSELQRDKKARRK